MAGDFDKDWKLKLRYGRLATDFEHFTAIAEGQIIEECEDDNDVAGRVIMGMKLWAASQEDAFDLVRKIGSQTGFELTGRIQLYETAPEMPPGENPAGYDIKFTPYEIAE